MIERPKNLCPILQSSIANHQSSMVQWVGRDSNPRTPKRPDLQSGAIDHSATYPRSARVADSYCVNRDARVVPIGPARGKLAEGFEPTTCGLQNRCSTTELREHHTEF